VLLRFPVAAPEKSPPMAGQDAVIWMLLNLKFKILNLKVGQGKSQRKIIANLLVLNSA